jgi:DNA-binding MarR family transcriptional regulator
MTKLTRKGRGAVPSGMVAAEAVEWQMLARLTDKEAELLRDVVQRCADALEGATQ